MRTRGERRVGEAIILISEGPPPAPLSLPSARTKSPGRSQRCWRPRLMEIVVKRIFCAHTKRRINAKSASFGEIKTEGAFLPSLEWQIAIVIFKKRNSPRLCFHSRRRGNYWLLATFPRGGGREGGFSFQNEGGSLIIANKTSSSSSVQPPERLPRTITGGFYLGRVPLQILVQAEPKSIVCVCVCV